MRWIWVALLGGCAMGADAGVIQRGLGDGLGGSVTSHLGVGGSSGDGPTLAVQADVRFDVAASGSRAASGASFLGGYAIAERARLLGRVGIWGSVLSSRDDRSVVPTFELSVFVPTDTSPGTPHGAGPISNGFVVGVRDDLDTDNYVTVFVGLALFIVPGP